MGKQTAIRILLGLLSVVLLFHFSILFELVSFKVVWAGRINTLEEMRVFEAVSILINVFLLVTLLIKKKNINAGQKNKLVDVIIWIFVFLFALNTLGNLFSETWLELILGTLLTTISSILCWIIVRKEVDAANY